MTLLTNQTLIVNQNAGLVKVQKSTKGLTLSTKGHRVVKGKITNSKSIKAKTVNKIHPSKRKTLDPA